MGTTNSLVNNLMMDSRQREPSVGDGATVLMWTDRYAATIVTVERFKTGRRAGEVKAVEVREDHAKRTDRNGQSESQTYEYSPNPSATVQRAPTAGMSNRGAGAACSSVTGRCTTTSRSRTPRR